MKTYLTVMRENYRNRFAEKHLSWIVEHFQDKVKAIQLQLMLREYRKAGEAAGIPLDYDSIVSRFRKYVVVDNDLPTEPFLINEYVVTNQNLPDAHC